MVSKEHKNTVLDFLKHFQQNNESGFLVFDSIFFLTENIKILLFLGIFEVLSGNCKSIESRIRKHNAGFTT